MSKTINSNYILESNPRSEYFGTLSVMFKASERVEKKMTDLIGSDLTKFKKVFPNAVESTKDDLILATVTKTKNGNIRLWFAFPRADEVDIDDLLSL